jgi:hypothetical protein
VEEMKKVLSLAGVMATTLLVNSITAKTQQPNTPLPQKAQRSIAAVEAQIANLKVERMATGRMDARQHTCTRSR